MLLSTTTGIFTPPKLPKELKMYNVLLNREIFRVTKAFQTQFLAVPADPNESASVPEGTPGVDYSR